MKFSSPKSTIKVAHLRSKSFVNNIIFCYARQKRSKSCRIYEYFNIAERKICVSKPGSSLNALANRRRASKGHILTDNIFIAFRFDVS